MTTKGKVFTWLSRIFTLFVPSGVVLWTFLIEKLISKDVSVASKLGLGGIVVGIIIVVSAIYFYNRWLKKKIEKLENDCLECVDLDQKRELVAKKKSYEAKKNILHDFCFIVPFIAIWLALIFVEKGVVSLRGTMLVVCISMSTGFGFSCVTEWLKSKGIKDENTTNNQKKD